LEIRDEKIIRDRIVFQKGSPGQTTEKAKRAGVLYEERWALPNVNP
jgi:hypothetical protein